MLDINNLCIAYNKNPVVSDFCLHIDKGEIISIVGESGSGKTTVIRSITGLLPSNGIITKGTIIFNNEILNSCSEQELRKIRGNDIAMIFQDSGAMLNPTRKIGTQFIEYIRTHKKVSKKEAYNKTCNIINKMNLKDADRILKSYPHEISGGQCQRIGIAIAMTFNPKLILADEPTSALDVTTQIQIVNQMLDMRESEKTSIIIVTHNISVALYISDKIIVMKDGKISDIGNRDYILNKSNNSYVKSLLNSVPSIKSTGGF